METRPSLSTSARSSRSSSYSSRKGVDLNLDLSTVPALEQPTPPSNTLLFTNLDNLDIYSPENLQSIRDLISQTATIHAFAPLKSFRRILVSFYSDDAAIAVRSIWDGESVMGDRLRVYFGQPTPIESKDEHLALPDAGKLFFISPPPSPPHGWEVRLEDAPNKLVHAEDLAEALAKLHHHKPADVNGGSSNGLQSPVTPTSESLPGRTRSRSSTLIFRPDEKKDGNSPDLPAVMVEDMTDEPEEELSNTLDSDRPLMAHTSRPPVELMHQA